MSLINDALKKAQKQQNQQPSPAAPTGSTLRPPGAREREPMLRPGVLLLGIAGLMVVMLAGGFIAVLLFRNPRPAVPAPSRNTPAVSAPVTPRAAPVPPPAAPSPPVAVARPAARPSPPPARPVASPVTSAPAAPAASATATPPPAVRAPLVSAKPAPTVAVPAERIPAAPAPASKAAPPSPPAVATTPAPPAEPPRNVKILEFLDKLSVTGVRVAGADSRVLMNNRVYKVNDMVDYVLGLRLVGVTSNRLTFRDDNGMTYTKSF